MIQTSDPTAYLADGAFAHLSDKDKVSILSLLARASERAYRRGAMQGAHIQATRARDLPTCLSSWRYGSSLASSPWLDSRQRGQTSHQRLEAEIGHSLRRIGLMPHGTNEGDKS
jgi:hypothetical protein